MKSLFATIAVLLTMACAGPPAEPLITRIAFGSCLDQKLPQPIWNAVESAKPDLFLFLGDNVYGDVSSSDMTELKAAYRRFGETGQLERLRARSRVLATWDDHDYGRDDAGADFPWRRAAQSLFLDFWKVPPDDPRHGRDGIYHSEIHGPPGRRIQILMLDTRFFRSPLKRTGQRRPKYLPDHDSPGKTMLGAAQWKWLAAELRKPAELRLVVSSIQVTADGHAWERWGNLPFERARLYRLVLETGAAGVVFLSGDRHLGGLYSETRDVPYPLYEATSSSLNRPWRNARENDPRQIGAVYGPENFGMVEIDWKSRRVTLALHGIDGKIVRRLDIPLPALAP